MSALRSLFGLALPGKLASRLLAGLELVLSDACERKHNDFVFVCVFENEALDGQVRSE